MANWFQLKNISNSSSNTWVQRYLSSKSNFTSTQNRFKVQISSDKSVLWNNWKFFKLNQVASWKKKYFFPFILLFLCKMALLQLFHKAIIKFNLKLLTFNDFCWFRYKHKICDWKIWKLFLFSCVFIFYLIMCNLFHALGIGLIWL